jgi:hypothetical protein
MARRANTASSLVERRVDRINRRLENLEILLMRIADCLDPYRPPPKPHLELVRGKDENDA